MSELAFQFKYFELMHVFLQLCISTIVSALLLISTPTAFAAVTDSVIGVPSQVADCPAGYTNTSFSCFRPADTQSNGGSTVANCPSGYTNTGLTCLRTADTQPNGGSTVASCPSGYANVGLTCFSGYKTASCSSKTWTGWCKSCPSGYYRAGFFCAKDANSLGESSMSCPASKFESVGRCYNNCPSGYTNTGTSCYRGPDTLGLSAMTCPANKFLSAGRCYNPCSSGYTNTGVSCYRGPDSQDQSVMTCPANYLEINTAIGGRCFSAGSPLINGAKPRPFWVYGHNPNTKEDVTAALDAGANALEPDIMVLSKNAIFNGKLIPQKLVVYHDDVLVTTRNPLTLNDYLDFVHDQAAKYPKLALIMIDIKSPVVTRQPNGDNGPIIVNAVHDHLLRIGKSDAINLKVIYSVGPDADSTIFKNMVPLLTINEGIQEDGTDDPDAMITKFQTNYPLGTQNYAFGDGTMFADLGLIGPNTLRAIEKSVYNRANTGLPKSSYAFDIIDLATMEEYITTGADAIITDNVTMLSKLVAARTDIRLATINDSPFNPLKEAYALKVYTADVTDAGTDANLTFTLTGCNGSATTTINASRNGRMEKGKTNYVTLSSKNLGNLTSLTVSRDNSGSSPDWDLDKVDISSVMWRNNAGIASAYFSNFIPTTGTKAVVLGGVCK